MHWTIFQMKEEILILSLLNTKLLLLLKTAPKRPIYMHLPIISFQEIS